MVNIKKTIIQALFLLSLMVLMGFTSVIEKEGKNLKKPAATDAGLDSYRLFVNKLSIPLNSKGVIADVNIGGSSQGLIDGKNFLYSAGFFLSGINDQGIMWSNAMATASRIEDYIPGNVAGDEDSQGMFVVKATDEPFGESWQEWATAVKYGAYFYDGDGDGVYNPVDKNGNGQWDPDEDSPDLLGDETVWTVYNDGVPSEDRIFSNVEPQGIEIRQTMWAYATSGDLGNIVFLRYSILNTGTVSEVMNDVYFGVWADPDLGDYTDDLVGSDTTLDAGYVYNDGDDGDFGVDPPCFLIDFFQGPWEETGNPEDMAFNTKGLLLGVDTIYGAKNLGLSSFVHYMQGHPTQGDPDNEEQARNYLRGLNQEGNIVDPCNWIFGTVINDDCTQIDGRFMYSGDPVALKGWINTTPFDQRQMSNTGPFKLEAGKPVDIIVAYVVGRGKSALASVKDAKKIDRSAQFVFQNNFNFPAPPPVVEPIVKTTEETIEFIWKTSPQFKYNAVGNGFNMKFQGYEVYMYNKNSTALVEGGLENAKLIAKYDVADDIKTVLFEDPVTNERKIIYEDGTQLDPAIYSDPEKGVLKLTIDTDPFTGGPLIKGKPYFFSIVGFALNEEEIVRYDAIGTYLIPGTATVGIIQNIPSIINDDKGNSGIVVGKDLFTPFYSGVKAKHVSGSSEAEVTYSVYDKSQTTPDQYEVGFFRDSNSTAYKLFYYIKDMDKGVMVADSQESYDVDDITNLHDGVTVNVQWIEPGIKNVKFEGGEPWFKLVNDSIKGVYYVGGDVSAPQRVFPVTSKSSKAISVEDMRRVELRFGETSKAFRYVKAPLRFVWAAGTGEVDSGFVDVPFAAYVKDDNGEERRLAVGFTENAFPTDSLKFPDGKWNPYGNVELTKEYIVIFNSDYSENPEDHLAYTGYDGRWADLGNGYRIKTTDPRVNDSLKAIAKSPWFDAMYVVGLSAASPSDNFNPTGTLIIEPYSPITVEDKYVYQIQSTVTADDEKALFDKVNVYPNPLFAYNPGVSYTGGRFDQPYVTFSNLPQEVTIKIYTLSGILIRTLEKNDLSPQLNWDLLNEDGLRVASGMYIALVSNPKLGDKVLKFAIIMPQKQIKYY